MPLLSAYFVRASLLYLAAGFSLGALLQINKGLPLAGFIWRLLPAHTEFLIWGWLLNLTMGVAFWILPRFSRPPKRGNEVLARLAFVLLNAGIWLVVFDSLFGLQANIPLLFPGRVLEILSAAAFAVHAWPRVKAAGA
jgi:cbb3-type cytochrome oxidase subunit 1